MHTLKALSLTLIALFSIQGCVSLNSQALDLHPEIQTQAKLPSDIRVEIKTKDLRSNKTIAALPTKDGKIAEIVLKDTHALLEHSAEHALEDMGVRRFYNGGFVMTLNLKKLDYQLSKQDLKSNVDLEMKLSIKVSKDGKDYTGNYATHNKHSYLKTPSDVENEKIINKLVSDTMNRAFNDIALIHFMKSN